MISKEEWDEFCRSTPVIFSVPTDKNGKPAPGAPFLGSIDPDDFAYDPDAKEAKIES